MVVGFAIDKYAYVSARHLPRFHPFRTRVSYSKVEEVVGLDDIEHPLVKACVNTVGWGSCHRLEITYQSDLPGRSGTGSSSAFAVGLLNALYALRGQYRTPDQLARNAVWVERGQLKEAGGVQDQYWSSFGGANAIHFRPGGAVDVFPLALSPAHLGELRDHILLFFTGLQRTSSDVAKSYGDMGEKTAENWAMLRLAEQGKAAVEGRDWERLGHLVDQSWRIKAGLSPQVCPSQVSTLYAAVRLAGAWGGKLTGAGGGGCLVCVASPDKHENVILAAEKLGCVHVPFDLDHSGSKVIFADKGATRERAS